MKGNLFLSEVLEFLVVGHVCVDSKLESTPQLLHVLSMIVQAVVLLVNLSDAHLVDSRGLDIKLSANVLLQRLNALLSERLAVRSLVHRTVYFVFETLFLLCVDLVYYLEVRFPVLLHALREVEDAMIRSKQVSLASSRDAAGV